MRQAFGGRRVEKECIPHSVAYAVRNFTGSHPLENIKICTAHVEHFGLIGNMVPNQNVVIDA